MGRFVARSQWLQESKQALPIENLGMTSKNTKEACEAIKVMQGEIPFTPRPEQVYEFFELRVGEKRSLGSSPAI